MVLEQNAGVAAWPEGARVEFVGTPAAVALYGGKPRPNERGRITSVPGPRGPTTYLPGPRGGTVYVEWDQSGIVGVSSMDLEIVKAAQVANARRAAPPAICTTDTDCARKELFASIRLRDRVTIVNRFGQERTGTVVMRGPYGWVLNMGGRHGTPAIADETNVVRVRTQEEDPEPELEELEENARRGRQVLPDYWQRTARGGAIWSPEPGHEYELEPHQGSFLIRFGPGGSMVGGTLNVGALSEKAKAYAERPLSGYLNYSSTAQFDSLQVAAWVAEDHWATNAERIKKIYEENPASPEARRLGQLLSEKRHYYVVDIGEDAFDLPTKREAIAAARKLVKTGGVQRGGRDEKAAAALVYRSGPEDREDVFIIWRDEAGQIHESEEPEEIALQAMETRIRDDSPTCCACGEDMTPGHSCGSDVQPNAHRPNVRGGGHVNPSWSKAEELWRRRELILPNDSEDPDSGLEQGVVDELFSWHGGQGSSVYSLASTGLNNLVSRSMIDAALPELNRSLRSAKGKEKKQLEALISELQMIRSHGQEFSAREAGMDIDEYEYDTWSEWQGEDSEQRPNRTSGGGDYYVWLMRKGSNEPLSSEGPHGPYRSGSAMSFARIGAQKGEHDRAVSRGKDPSSASFAIVSIYEAGTGNKIG